MLARSNSGLKFISHHRRWCKRIRPSQPTLLTSRTFYAFIITWITCLSGDYPSLSAAAARLQLGDLAFFVNSWFMASVRKRSGESWQDWDSISLKLYQFKMIRALHLVLFFALNILRPTCCLICPKHKGSDPQSVNERILKVASARLVRK